MRLVIDMDSIKYTIGSVCEKRSIEAIHKETGNVYKFKTRSELWGHWKKRAGGWLAEHNKGRDTPWMPDDFIIKDIQEPEPVSHALQTVKNQINNICTQLFADSYYGYIGKGDSWRVERSTIMRYKGARAANLKPLLLEDIEEYLLKHHNGQIIRHLESDDQCVIDCTANPSLCLTGWDKDYLGCQLTLFNPDKMTKPQVIKGLGELFLDAKGEVRGHGRKFFYYQVLAQDDSDCYAANSASDVKWGEKSAYKVLQPCKNDVECWQVIVDSYKFLYPEPKRIVGWRGYKDQVKRVGLLDNYKDFEIDIDWLVVLQENVDMAHMKRTIDDRLDVPYILKKLNINH